MVYDMQYAFPENSQDCFNSLLVEFGFDVSSETKDPSLTTDHWELVVRMVDS